MINVILHGDNQVASREKLNLLINDGKLAGKGLIYLDNPSKKELLDATSAQSLFGDENIIVIENFLTGNKDAVGILSQIQDVPLIIWEKKGLTPSVVKKLSGKFSVLEFKLPTVLFALLDSIYPKNAKKILEFLNVLKQETEPEFIFIMISGRVRQLLWAKLELDTLTVAPWQRNKLTQQARRFTNEQLLMLHSKLLETDRSQKLSQLPENLTASLELLLTSI